MNMVIKILTFIDGFVIRDGKILMVNRMDKNDDRYKNLSCMIANRGYDMEYFMDEYGRSQYNPVMLVLYISRHKEYILRIYEEEFYYENGPEIEQTEVIREFSFFRSMCNEELLCYY